VHWPIHIEPDDVVELGGGVRMARQLELARAYAKLLSRELRSSLMSVRFSPVPETRRRYFFRSCERANVGVAGPECPRRPGPPLGLSRFREREAGRDQLGPRLPFTSLLYT
jgi:hypothetical protein